MIARIVDLETTGMEPTDEVVEIAALDVDTESHEGLRIQSALVQPTLPIPPEASAVHHLTNDMVAGAPAWGDVWPHYLDAHRWQGVDLFVAHFAQFDGQFITDEMRGGRPLLCTYKSALRVWPKSPGHSNQILRYWLGLRVTSDGPPHRALADALVTNFLFLELLKHATIEQMLAWTAEPALLPRIPFGMHRGTPWSALPIDYLDWMIDPKKNDFDYDTRWNARHELVRRYTEAASATVASAETLEDLRFWFGTEKGARERLGIIAGTDAFDRIADACTARKADFVCEIGHPWPPVKESVAA